MTEAAAGWYPNPEDPMTERWWDGFRWSDATRSLSSLAPPPPASSPTYYGPKPDTYLVWSILTTLFCCLPFGIVSIVHAAKVDGLWSSGDLAGARKASADAKRWAQIAVAASVVVFVGYIVLIAAVTFLGESADDSFRY